ncbi:hypothetical protein GCM10027217_40790 [Pseudomaricurvus hydrocarbonicus]
MVVIIFVVATLMTAAAAVGLQYHFTRVQASEAAVSRFSALASASSQFLRSVDRDIVHTVKILSTYPNLVEGLRASEAARTVFAEAMHNKPMFYAMYVGLENGSFYEVINLNSEPGVRKQLRAAAADRWVTVTVPAGAGPRQRHYRYYDTDFQLRAERREATDFNVSQRPWYRQALPDRVNKTEPYLLRSLSAPGQTYSMRLTGTAAVIGVDITLSTLDRYLHRNRFSDRTDMIVFEKNGTVISRGRPGLSLGALPVSQSLAATAADPQLVAIAQSRGRQGRLHEVEVQGEPHFMFVTPFGGNSRTGEFFSVTIPVQDVLAPVLAKLKWSVLLTAGWLLLLMPLPWVCALPMVKPIQKLAVENAKVQQRAYDQLAVPRSHIQEIDALGCSMTTMAEAIEAHEARQVALMDAFIEVIAQAIDDKSPYTAGHCERVPELAFMLAREAEAATTGCFKGFKFHSEDEWREFRVAAWLHDCGKITTPEHIVDKGSKLEAIYNRIHEVRMRFEVLWRDAEIEYWQQCLRNPSQAAEYQQQWLDRQQQLQDDFAFVAAMNVGGEVLSDDKKRRLQQLATTTWVRHFDDRLGLSPVEQARIASLPDRHSGPGSATLPCEEPLLADKPEHIVERQHDVDYDPRLGINMAVPTHLYDLGELHNLCVERGTLTAEDRFKINEHVISTIRMLDKLPFPPELARVPRYASTHHETMNGTGYPRQLTGDQLSVPERIMVLADIFEALTAADRPYKQAKPVSVAIDILAQMVTNGHVDAQVFDLFLRRGVYLKYAQRYLPQAQIDEVDLSQYLVAGVSG